MENEISDTWFGVSGILYLTINLVIGVESLLFKYLETMPSVDLPATLLTKPPPAHTTQAAEQIN